MRNPKDGEGKETDTRPLSFSSIARWSLLAVLTLSSSFWNGGPATRPLKIVPICWERGGFLNPGSPFAALRPPLCRQKVPGICNGYFSCSSLWHAASDASCLLWGGIIGRFTQGHWSAAFIAGTLVLVFSGLLWDDIDWIRTGASLREGGRAVLPTAARVPWELSLAARFNLGGLGLNAVLAWALYQSLILLKNAAGSEWQPKPLSFNVAHAVSTTFNSLAETRSIPRTCPTACKIPQWLPDPGWNCSSRVLASLHTRVNVATSVVFFILLLFQRRQDRESSPPWTHHRC